MSTKLLNIYRSILKYSGLEADADGLISAVIDGKKQPSLIDGVRMVLPTDHHLRTFMKNEKIVFHPFTENILRGESEIIQKLKLTINVKLNYTIATIGQNLLNLVASPEFHSRLNPEQMEIMTCIKDCDEKAVVNFIQVMVNGSKSKVDRLFANIYLKRGGTVHGKRYSRVGIVSFPFYEDLINNKVEKVRVKDVETYKQLFKFIFPDIDEPDCYNYGSNSQVAPFLDALMKSSCNIASRLNDILLTYKDFIDNHEELMFDSDWVEAFENLDDLSSEIRKIPVQYGNDGSISTATELPATPMPVPVPVQQQPVQAPQQYPQNNVAPVQQQAPQVPRTARGLSFSALTGANQPQMPMVPVMPSPFMQQQPVYNAAMMASAQPPAFAVPQQNVYPTTPPFMGSDGNMYIQMSNGSVQYLGPPQQMNNMYRV